MSAYLISKDLSFSVHFPDASVRELGTAVKRWLREGEVFAFTGYVEDPDETGAEIWVNWARVTEVFVSDDQPSDTEDMLTLHGPADSFSD